MEEMMPLESVEFCNVVLEKIQLAAQSRVSRTVLDSVRIQDISQLVAQNLQGDLILRLTASVPGREDRVVTDYVTVPATWWDAFKERFFPRAKRRTRQIATQTKVYHVCPHVELPKTDQRHWSFITGGA